MVDRLEPQLELLQQEYVLIQAWKKTASHIRYHNWFSDTIELDWEALNLQEFIGTLRERLQSPNTWQNKPLRIVPAPKSQKWAIKNKKWNPIKEKDKQTTPLRPLAHVDLADQVVATALMLCLADRVEDEQGDPRWPVHDIRAQPRRVISYGNRLFCDSVDHRLRHRWGSTRLYRSYYQDFQAFCARPKVVADSIVGSELENCFVVHADLKQFYDRVSPELLFQAIKRIRTEKDDPEFYSLLESVLCWHWHKRDKNDVNLYKAHAGIPNFDHVALPQGLVASGFFANSVLLPFDGALRNAFGDKIAPGIRLVDACRYVDDLRILVEITPDLDCARENIRNIVSKWLTKELNKQAEGLALSEKKTRGVALGGEDRRLVFQGAKMNRIQSAISGGFDALRGGQILDSIQSLMRSQEALSAQEGKNGGQASVPDVGDQTVARFCSRRYRNTYRSVRPLLQCSNEQSNAELSKDAVPSGRIKRAVRIGRRCEDFCAGVD